MTAPILLTTTIPGVKVQAHITLTKRGKNAGSYYIHGYLVERSKHGGFEKIDNVAYKEIKYFDTYEDAEAQLPALVGRLVKAYYKVFTPKTSNSSTPFADAYHNFPDKSLLEIGREWSHSPHSTAQQMHTYLVKSVIPLLDQYGHSITYTDIKDIETTLIARAMTSKRGNQNLESATNSVAKYLSACGTMLDNLFFFSPPGTIPHISFEIAPTESSISYEQVKALAPPLRIILAYVMHLYPPHLGGLILGMALMYYGGLRPGEAVYPTIGDIQIHDNGRFASYRVRFQAYNKPPKSDAGYRTIVLPYAFVQLLAARIDYLKTCGFSVDAISNMPIVASRDDPYKYARSEMLSDFIKKIMKKCGFVETPALKLAMEYQPMYDANGVKIKDARAYILRRDFCSRLFNICGIQGDLADYLLGHENPKYKINDSSMNLDKLRIIGDSLERFVAMPEVSYHPEFAPIELTSKRIARTQAPKHTAFSFTAKCNPGETIDLTIIATCAETQDNINIETSATTLAVSKRDPDVLVNTAPVIHPPYEMDLYLRCREKAEILVKEIIDET
ncbi:MAG: hypothetical protein IKU32_04430 [Clostridia bacterium]|nr:hypothetical protein [Clostridia bacterium]